MWADDDDDYLQLSPGVGMIDVVPRVERRLALLKGRAPGWLPAGRTDQLGLPKSSLEELAVVLERRV